MDKTKPGDEHNEPLKIPPPPPKKKKTKTTTRDQHLYAAPNPEKPTQQDPYMRHKGPPST